MKYLWHYIVVFVMNCILSYLLYTAFFLPVTWADVPKVIAIVMVANLILYHLFLKIEGDKTP